LRLIPKLPASLLTRAWTAGAGPRLTLVLGILVSAAWAIFAGVWTVRFIADTLRQPALASEYKVALLVLLAVVVLVLVIPLPAQWLMYALLRLEERRSGVHEADT
jgi:hypothetical protein